MDTKRICSICGKPLAPSAPEGLCPECLLKAGLGTGVDIGPDTGGKAPRFTPPKIEELAAKFPQLEILELIGQGGMGAVYKARQKQLDRLVALKILPPQAGSAAFAERFTREARALAKLNHPHIVTLYEFGQSDGLFYFLMEFVDGVNLRQLLGHSRISPREALVIVPQICEALQFAHDSGIVHRDIKPENILLDKKGQVKIADFGVAKMIAESLTEAAEKTASAAGELTEAGSTLGTPQYMAPEQIKSSAEVDHRADIYSLGVVFYQMLTGELPSVKIEPPSSRMRGIQIDVRLDEVVLRALEKKPELRFQQASDVKTAVETIATTPQPAPPETPPGFKHYKDAKGDFELDLPEGWNKFPPDLKNSPAELLRFVSNENGFHLLILFQGSSRYFSLKDASDWAQKQLAKAGFGNFVSAETTIGGRPARTLDFDRPRGDGTWSCRHYFVAERATGYVLGFGTTDKAGMFKTFERMANSFRFKPTGDDHAFKPFIPKSETIAGDEPKSESSGQKAKPELHREGYTVRIEPVSSPKAARRVGVGAVIALLAIILVIPLATIALLLSVKSHQPKSQNELSEAAFLQKFNSDQIAQATITYNHPGGAATITGKFIETDANGKIVRQNGQPVEESFVVPNAVLTPALEDKLLPLKNISVEIPNPMVSNIGYQLLFFVICGIALLSFIVLIVYLKTSRRFGAAVAIAFLAVVVAGIVLSFLHSFFFARDYARMRAAAQVNVLFHVRVFESDAGLVDQLIPVGERQIGVRPNVKSFLTQKVNTSPQPNAWTNSQFAQASPAVVHRLLQGIASGAGLLVDHARAVSGVFWGQTGFADGWSYSVVTNSLFGGGVATVFLGVQKTNGVTEVGISGELNHSIDTMIPGRNSDVDVNSRFFYEGPMPQTNELVFLVPFLRRDGSQHYLVTVFDFNGENNEEVDQVQTANSQGLEQVSTHPQSQPTLPPAQKTIGMLRSTEIFAHNNLAIAFAKSEIGFPLHEIVARFAGPPLSEEAWRNASGLIFGYGRTLAPSPYEVTGSEINVQSSDCLYACPNECDLQFALPDDTEAKEAARQMLAVMSKPLPLCFGEHIPLFHVGQSEAWLEVRQMRPPVGQLAFINTDLRYVNNAPLAGLSPVRPAGTIPVNSAAVTIPPDAMVSITGTVYWLANSVTNSSNACIPGLETNLFSTTLTNDIDQPGLYWLTWRPDNSHSTNGFEIFIHDGRTARELHHYVSGQRMKFEWRADWWYASSTVGPGLPMQVCLLVDDGLTHFVANRPNPYAVFDITMTMQPLSGGHAQARVRKARSRPASDFQ